jgi:hypothetical protein
VVIVVVEDEEEEEEEEDEERFGEPGAVIGEEGESMLVNMRMAWASCRTREGDLVWIGPCEREGETPAGRSAWHP